MSSLQEIADAPSEPGIKKYRLIYADPPWTYDDKANAGQRGSGYKYSTMSIEEICAMKVAGITAIDCLLAMWWVPTMPLEALRVVEAWGFTMKTMKGFTWHKMTKNGKSHIGMGNYTRANTEDCLFAIKGAPGRRDAGVRQFISAGIGRHSAKPPEARDRLVKLVGDVPRVEMFARQSTDGWDVFGDEVEDSISL